MQHASILFTALLGGASVASAQVDADGASPLPPVSQEAIFDDLDQVTPAWEAAAVADLVRGLPLRGGAPEGGFSRTPRAYTGPIPAKRDAANELFSRYSVEGLLTQPLFDEASDADVLWTRVRKMKASFGAEGLTAYPAFGKEATQSYAARFELNGVTIGGQDVPFARSPKAERVGNAVTLDREALRETYHVTLDGIEQTFVFDDLPAVAGDLRLSIDVDSNLGVLEDADGIHFVHETLGGITYGDAFVFDASGRREPIERVWTGDSIALTVPAKFLAGATFPITVDPPVTSFTSTAGTPDDSNVDVCYTGGSGLYWAVFEDYFDGTQTDVYAVSFNTLGTVVNFITIEFGSNDWMDPKIAYHVGADRCLVVASEIDTSGFGTIQGQLIDCATAIITGAQFQISSFGALKVHPDVGGNNWNSTTNSFFAVTWSAVWSPGVWHQVQYRIVDWDGTLITGLESITATNEVHNAPALSETHGDGDLLGDWWTIAWTADSDNNGLGNIMARRVVWSGSTALGAGNFLVAGSGDCSAPRVTSRFNRDLLNVADRPSIVAYEREFSTLSGTPATQRSIYTRVITDGAAEVESPVSWQLEDFDLELDQREPAIACDGNCFYLVYSEVWYGDPAGSDYDMYMLSGCITDRLNGAEIALGERHQNMAFSVSPERNGAVATIWDGSENSFSDDGMAIWEDQNVANGGTLEGATLENPTFNQSVVRAVGRQFCDNNPNSGGAQFGRQASWSWLEGDQSLTGIHVYRASDLPTSSFGYAVISTVFANVNNPAGSLGRVCVVGGGRYVDQIGSSGTTGTLSTTITPLNVPSPTGFISMGAGETWGFQYWHRDIAPGGTASSNFSTACVMQFTN